MAVGDAHVFPGFLTPVLTQVLFPKLLFSHASAEVRVKICDRTTLKASAEDELNLPKGEIFVFDRVENIVGKEENAGKQHFLLFPQCLPAVYQHFLLFPHIFKRPQNSTNLNA